jgi:hypothetical protein
MDLFRERIAPLRKQEDSQEEGSDE